MTIISNLLHVANNIHPICLVARNLKAEYERLLRGRGLPGRSRNGWSEHKSPSHVDDDAKRIEKKLQVLDENNQHLQNELSQLQGMNVRESR